nr:hypothetical protein CFP56_08076 [Quercus suber]
MLMLFHAERRCPSPMPPGHARPRGYHERNWHRKSSSPSHTFSGRWSRRSVRLGSVHGIAQTTCERWCEQNTSSATRCTRRSSKDVTTHLSFAVCPEIHHHRDHVVQSRVGALIQQHRHQRRQRQPDQSRDHASVQRGAGQPSQRPFVGQADERDDEVDDLQGGEGFDGGIEVLGEEVEEELGPEEAFERRGELICDRESR